MYKKLLGVLLIILVMTACGGNSEIEEVIRNNVKDPASAQFKDLVISDNGKRACIAWNAKNSLGGYSDWHFAELKNAGNGWTVLNMEQTPSRCTAQLFKLRDDFLKIREKILNMEGGSEEIRAKIQQIDIDTNIPEEMLNELIINCNAYLNAVEQ